MPAGSFLAQMGQSFGMNAASSAGTSSGGGIAPAGALSALAGGGIQSAGAPGAAIGLDPSGIGIVTNSKIGRAHV